MVQQGLRVEPEQPVLSPLRPIGVHGQPVLLPSRLPTPTNHSNRMPVDHSFGYPIFGEGVEYAVVVVLELLHHWEINRNRAEEEQLLLD